MDRAGNGVVFSQCGYFFYGPGLNFDSSEMIYINVYTSKLMPLGQSGLGKISSRYIAI